MKKLTVLAFAILLGSAIGCGNEGNVAPSAAAPVTSPEQDMAGIEKEMESKDIDPATYGK